MNELSTKEKDVIREALRTYVAKYPSQNKAAGSLKNTSVGTISSIMNGKYENISDEMFRNIASQVGCRSKDTGWQIVETSAYQEIRYALDDAQRWRNVTWVVGEAGCGKTTTARLYTEEHKEVFYILCSEDMKKGDFVREIAQKVGIKTDGHNIREIWGLILDDVIQMDAPLLIFDEADKLTEPVFHYFISMYNKLEDKSGIVSFPPTTSRSASASVCATRNPATRSFSAAWGVNTSNWRKRLPAMFTPSAWPTGCRIRRRSRR